MTTTATPRRVFLHLLACTALALSLALGEVWGLAAHQARGVRRVEIQLDLERLEDTIDILGSWFRRSRIRPRYSRREKRRILDHAERHGLSAAELARSFLLSLATAYRWMKASPVGTADPEPARPLMPCRRICDNRRRIVVEMAQAGIDGNLTIARQLHHQGETLSPRSVGRFRDQPMPIPRAAPSKHLEPSDPLASAAACVPGPQDRPRPRLARLLRDLRDAFTEGISFDTQSRFERGANTTQHTDSRALLRSRRAEQLTILLARLSRIPPRHRAHYTATERARILALKSRFRLSNDRLGRLFLLDPGTFSEWNRDVDAPDRRKRPLVATLADLHAAVAEASERLAYVPRRLRGQVEATLAAIAEKTPLRTRRRRGRARSRTVIGQASRLFPAIVPTHPNHYWSCDITTIELRFSFHLTAIVDLFSRDILVWDLFPSQPSGRQVKALFEEAVARHGKPECFLTDKGGQFRQGPLVEALDELGVEHRTGAVGQKGAIAIIERTWRTLKECLDTARARSEIRQTLHARLGVVIDYYRTKRPHHALGNATPAEVYRDETSLAHHARPAPRGWKGEPCPPLPFVIRYAFPDEKRLPFLIRAA